jgi:hypothetical protein
LKNKHLPIAWPPIVKGGKIPPLMKVRDLLLTLLAWAVLLYFMRNLWIFSYEYCKDIILNMDTSGIADWSLIWTRIAPFLMVASLLVLWIVIIGSLRRRAIRSTGLIQGKASLRTVQQQFPFRQIDLALLAKRFGVEKSQLEEWQKMRTVDITVDEVSGEKIIAEVNRST